MLRHVCYITKSFSHVQFNIELRPEHHFDDRCILTVSWFVHDENWWFFYGSQNGWNEQAIMHRAPSFFM